MMTATNQSLPRRKAKAVQGDSDVIEFLNEHLTSELTIINQYFLNSRMLVNWGLPGLGTFFHELSIDEMKDSVELIDRILYLDGHPNLQRLDTVRIGESPEEMLTLALQCEQEAIERLQRGVELAVDKRDTGTREMLATMLREEEEHLDTFESMLDAMNRVGVQNYLARYTTPEST
jgi:bacterioferritin